VSTVADLAELVKHLRAAGFRVDTRQYLMAHELLLTCAAQGRPIHGNTEKLVSHLGPIFCTSSEEQDLFPALVLAWIGEPPSSPPVSPPVSFKSWRLWRRLLSVSVGVAVTAAILVFLVYEFSTVTLSGIVETETIDGKRQPAPQASLYFRANPVALDQNGHFRIAVSRARRRGLIRAELEGYLAPDLQVDRESRSPLYVTLKPIPKPAVEGHTEIEVKEPRILSAQVGPSPPDTRLVTVTWLKALAAASAVTGLVFVLLFAAGRFRRVLVLRQLPVKERPELATLVSDVSSPSSLGDREFRRIASSLRRPWEQDLLELSLSKTIVETCRNIGVFTPVFTPRRVASDYLVLIGRQSQEDHEARLFDELTGRLREQGLTAERYYFRDDPRVCFRPEEGLHAFSLQELLTKHHSDILLLFGESSVCFNPVLGQIEPWVYSVQSLPRRVLFTPEGPCNWTTREWELAKAGFVVLPAGENGLQKLARIERDWRIESLFPAPYARPFPPLLDVPGWRWLDRNEPPPDTVERLLRQLRGFLGPAGYAWMCACAIYPEIVWPLTVHLAGVFAGNSGNGGQHAILERTLPSLARLPWFRYGSMPDWLRKRLIVQLETPREKAVRSLLEGLLEKMARQTLMGLTSEKGSREIKIGRWIGPRDILRSAPSESPLSDHVFLGFMSGASVGPLALRVPAVLRRLFRRVGHLPVTQPKIGQGLLRSLSQRVLGHIRALTTFKPNWAMLALSLAVGVISMFLLSYLIGSERSLEEAESYSSIAFSPDGKQVASGSTDKTVIFWDAATGKEIRRLSGHTDPVTSIAFSPDGKQVASGSTDKTVIFWDAATGKEIRRLSGHTDPVTSIAFSPDGKLLASGSLDNTVKLWNVADGRQVRTFVLTGGVSSIAFSPDGKQVASGSTDKTVIFWDAATGKEIRRLSGHADPVTSVAFSPDGRWLASGSEDKIVMISDTSDQKVQPIVLTGPKQGVSAVAYEPDGGILASVAGSNVFLWAIQRAYMGDKQPAAFIPQSVTYVYFDFDKYNLRPGDAEVLKPLAAWLLGHPEAGVILEGNTDERYTVETAIVLGQKRAEAVKTYLMSLGVPGGRIQTVSNGKERPLDPGHTEQAWAKNRRVEIRIKFNQTATKPTSPSQPRVPPLQRAPSGPDASPQQRAPSPERAPSQPDASPPESQRIQPSAPSPESAPSPPSRFRIQ
jgi:outer membrane protein OmpA-like peptidoglycan-associated protein